LIKAVIFDCFGVLVGGSFEVFIAKYLSHDSELVESAREIDHRASQGKVTFEEVAVHFSKLAKIPLEETLLVLDHTPRNIDLLQFISKELKGKFKLGLLSNASDDWLDELFTSKDLELFDEIILSFQIGYAKPEASAYEITAGRLSVRLDECVFIDDREEYIEGAKHVGMKAILFKDVDTLKLELENVLG
jgi:HAD superfamily hydrolase (TIGR01549 family)